MELLLIRFYLGIDLLSSSQGPLPQEQRWFLVDAVPETSHADKYVCVVQPPGTGRTPIFYQLIVCTSGPLLHIVRSTLDGICKSLQNTLTKRLSAVIRVKHSDLALGLLYSR